MSSEKKLMPISVQALKRMPLYLQYLKKCLDNGVTNISATAMARELKLYDVQVRKDLSAVSKTAGKPKTGFLVSDLINDLEDYMGYNNVNEAILVGAGNLGRALLSYKGFDDYGLKIIAAFDNNDSRIGVDVAGIKVLAYDKLINLCQRMHIHIGIITVPDNAAQQVCNDLITAGIQVIWNFAHVNLQVPSNVMVQNENMAASLALISRHLRR